MLRWCNFHVYFIFAVVSSISVCQCRKDGFILLNEKQLSLLSETGLDDAPTILNTETSGIDATFSSFGLNYVKDVLVGRVLDEIIPLSIPDITETTVTYLGTVSVALTRINVSYAHAYEADIDLSNGGVTIFTRGVEANVTFSWKYTYAGWFGDSGTADVKVSGMQAAVTFNLTAVNGTLEMAVLEHAVVIERLMITLHNYYSWLYNWLVTSFQNHLRAAIESAINTGMVTASLKLNNYLQDFPRLIPVDSTAAIDATIPENPVVDANRLSLRPRGEFVSLNQPMKSKLAPPRIPNGPLCEDPNKMVSVALSDFVINSAANVYFQAGILTYSITELPSTTPFHLNTASWRFFLPGLYRNYPNQDMVLYFFTSASPTLTFTESGLNTDVAADMIIQVVQPDGSREGVACLGMELSLDGWAGINGNNFTGSFELQSLALVLKWSNIGNLPVHVLQGIIHAAVNGVVMPLLNHRLTAGFPLPIIPSVQILNASISYRDSILLVCTDIEYTGGYFQKASDSMLE